MGRSFDTSGSYEAALVTLTAFMTGAAALMLSMPRYGTPRAAVDPV
jgi:hypothetical protein